MAESVAENDDDGVISDSNVDFISYSDAEDHTDIKQAYRYETIPTETYLQYHQIDEKEHSVKDALDEDELNERYGKCCGSKRKIRCGNCYWPPRCSYDDNHTYAKALTPIAIILSFCSACIVYFMSTHHEWFHGTLTRLLLMSSFITTFFVSAILVSMLAFMACWNCLSCFHYKKIMGDFESSEQSYISGIGGAKDLEQGRRSMAFLTPIDVLKGTVFTPPEKNSDYVTMDEEETDHVMTRSERRLIESRYLSVEAQNKLNEERLRRHNTRIAQEQQDYVTARNHMQLSEMLPCCIYSGCMSDEIDELDGIADDMVSKSNPQDYIV